MRPSEDVSIASLGRSVRFSLQQEEIKGFSEEDGEPNYLRYKTRYTFIHKVRIGSSPHALHIGDILMTFI